jgi:hypothetical protein
VNKYNMPNLNEARQKNAARIASGGQTGTGIGNPEPPQTPINFAPTPAQDQPAGAGLPQRGMFPANLVLASDRSDSSRVFRGSSMRSGTFPYQPQQIKTGPVTVTAVSAAAAAATLALETNYLANPNQSVLNLVAGPGVSLIANPDGSVVISGGGGDGLTHGTLPWESDPGFTVLRDDFFNVLGATAISGTFPASGIGELGWALLGNTGGQGGMLGGVPPYIGQYGWSNAPDTSQLGVLTLAGSGSFSNVNYSQLGWALMDNPGWAMSFVFKVEAGNPISGSPIFSAAQKSIYVGLFGQDIGRDSGGSPPDSRPNFFMGLRYDTSTSDGLGTIGPPINDSFFTFEVVENPVGGSSVRNNNQGTTQVTTIAPVPGTWHRLDIFCSAIGTVTMMLDGANAFTATVPTFAITADFSGLINDGFARLNWSVSGTNPPQSAWNTGSTIVVTGFGAGSGLVSLNGTWQLTASDDTFMGFDALGVADTSGTGMGTVTGYPSWIPGIWMGNDDTASPTANNMMMVVDFFSFIWNPNLGPSAPGTPNAALPRYF